MIININNIEVNKRELLHLINNGTKLNAIKLVRDKTKMGLKECKDVIDNLSDDSNIYDGKIYVPETNFKVPIEKLKELRQGTEVIL